MSVENHPNFHAANFTTQITAAFYESLRGGANKDNAPDIAGEILVFVARIEDMVDSTVDEDNEDDDERDDYDEAEGHRDDVWCHDPDMGARG